jgi:hypothetical protein
VGESDKQAPTRKRGRAGKMIAKAAIILCKFNHQIRQRSQSTHKTLYFKPVFNGRGKCVRLPGLNLMSQNVHQEQITTDPAAL